MTLPKKVDFIMSHLDGPAKEEVRMYSQKERSIPDFLLDVLTRAFGEKCSSCQLLMMFYEHKQKEHFRPQGKTLLPTGDWLRLTAANGLCLEIPYVGYLELGVKAFGVMIPQRGILVIKSPASKEARQCKKITIGLVGMNIITQLQEPYKNGKMEIVPEVLKIVSRAKSISAHGFAKVACKSKVRIPAISVSIVKNNWMAWTPNK